MVLNDSDEEEVPAKKGLKSQRISFRVITKSRCPNRFITLIPKLERSGFERRPNNRMDFCNSFVVLCEKASDMLLNK